MNRPRTSGRIEPRVMDRLVAAAALEVAAAYGIGADAVAAACSTRSDGTGFVAAAVERECAPED